MSSPSFRYHPDPIATGSVTPSDVVCKACGQSRGLIYTGPVYGIEATSYREAICPWCIADGTAHEKLNVEFTDTAAVGGYGAWEPVPASAVEEVAYRTPSFAGWQQERWFTHCGDAAEFLGIVGRTELESLGAEAIEAIRQECGFEGAEVDSWYEALDRDHGPTAYIFRCRHCGKLGGYSDCH
jgi:uncharacterized protein CbrC (UPF0167 family)